MIPTVSVIIPCYNGEKWLALTLESISAQSYRDFEVIVVDDGSTDNSSRIIERYCLSDDRYKYVSQKNSGIAAALNLGLSLAKGKWIARLDADDLCHPDRLKVQLELASTLRDIVFVGSGSSQIDGAGKFIRECIYPTGHRQLYRALTTRRKFPAHSSAFFNRELAIAVGGYRPGVRRAEDVDLWLRLSERGRLTSVSLPLIAYRTHDTQISLDEGGLRCFSDNLLANLSHYARIRGIADPVEAGAAELQTISEFIDAIAKKSYRYKLIDALTKWRKQRQNISTKSMNFRNFKNLLVASFRLAWFIIIDFSDRNRDARNCQRHWHNKIAPNKNISFQNVVE